MILTISGFALLALGLLALALQRFYSSVPAKELKRLAARGDHLAQALYRPVAYGASLRLLLWVVVGLSLPVGLVLLGQSLPPLVLLLVTMTVLAIALIWLPSLRLTVHSARFAVWLAPALAKILHYTQPVLQHGHVLNRYRQLDSHSGLYEKEDITELLAQQKEQADNRLTPEELDILLRALHFSDKKAADILLPRAQVRLIDGNETLGPIVLDELHKSGQPSFLVYDKKPEHVVGTLLIEDAARAKNGSRVADLMRPQLCYVNEEFTLPQVARAFTATGQQVAVVVNNFEEFVGTVSLAGLLQQLYGEQTAEPEIAYEDAAAVAAYQAPPPVTDNEEEESTEPQPSPESPEVIE